MVPPRRSSVLALALMLSLGVQLACSASDEVDVVERAATAAQPPARRIVSLSRMASALLLDLGCADRIVGVDAASSGLPGLATIQVLPVEDAERARHVGAFEPDLIEHAGGENVAHGGDHRADAARGAASPRRGAGMTDDRGALPLRAAAPAAASPRRGS